MHILQICLSKCLHLMICPNDCLTSNRLYYLTNVCYCNDCCHVDCVVSVCLSVQQNEKKIFPQVALGTSSPSLTVSFHSITLSLKFRGMNHPKVCQPVYCISLSALHFKWEFFIVYFWMNICISLQQFDQTIFVGVIALVDFVHATLTTVHCRYFL